MTGEALGEGPLVPSRHVAKTQLTWAAEEPKLWNLKLPSGLPVSRIFTSTFVALDQGPELVGALEPVFQMLSYESVAVTFLRTYASEQNRKYHPPIYQGKLRFWEAAEVVGKGEVLESERAECQCWLLTSE